MALHVFKQKWFLNELELDDVKSFRIQEVEIQTNLEPDDWQLRMGTDRRSTLRKRTSTAEPPSRPSEEPGPSAKAPPTASVPPITDPINRRGRGRPRLLRPASKVDSTPAPSTPKPTISSSTKDTKATKAAAPLRPSNARVGPTKGKKRRRRRRRRSSSSQDGDDQDSEEPVYCICKNENESPYGEKMISCDNDLCTMEWFHFKCVHIRILPKGKWYCPLCRADKSTPSIMKPMAEFLKELEQYNMEQVQGQDDKSS